jgi:hypothetical protein
MSTTDILQHAVVCSVTTPTQGRAAAATRCWYGLQVEDKGHLKNFVVIFLLLRCFVPFDVSLNAKVLFEKKIYIHGFKKYNHLGSLWKTRWAICFFDQHAYLILRQWVLSKHMQYLSPSLPWNTILTIRCKIKIRRCLFTISGQQNWVDTILYV